VSWQQDVFTQWRLIESIGKRIGVKVSPFLQKYRYWYRQYFRCKVLVSLLAILFASIVNKPEYRSDYLRDPTITSQTHQAGRHGGGAVRNACYTNCLVCCGLSVCSL